ncbi:hypothetical protein PILCRDRAFT_814911 [Piloderma croceum F 1598]|uniref:Uncharacterized protein n=1 Tax=Piloderma croceum (strain F 1598) TaxID=765440 RepID=A0A0C3BLR2_PILCF|nr:hypothetical protein PILCRDRAFT_814911 [Piloderma croceum F 1598]
MSLTCLSRLSVPQLCGANPMFTYNILMSVATVTHLQDFSARREMQKYTRAG